MIGNLAAFEPLLDSVAARQRPSKKMIVTDLDAATASLGRWLEKRYRSVLCGLLLLTAVTRVALVFGSPRPYGYAWDFYHEGVIWAYEHGRLPSPNDCWECYNPPLYFMCGVPLYALGTIAANGDAAGGLRLLSLLSMLCAGFVIYFCHQTLRLLRPSRGTLLLGTTLALVFPCLFISSYGAENDILLAALMTAFFYRLCLYHLRPGRASWREPVVLGILAGLSALTKYPGLLAMIAAALLMSQRLVLGPRRRRAARDLIILVSVAGAVSGWHYARNMRTAGRPFLDPPGYSNMPAADGRLARNWRRYDFHSFRIKEVVDLYRPEIVGALNDFPVYAGVFSTLHALAWTDMSFFSVPSRHGWKLPLHYAEGGGKIQLVAQTPANRTRVPPYPLKHARLWLVDLVLRLGVFPSLLALLGFLTTLRRRALRPFVVFSGVSLAAYAWWFLSQPAWALKTKYILFLLPVYVVYTVMGLRTAYRLDRRLALAATAGLIAALLVGEAYLFMFALG